MVKLITDEEFSKMAFNYIIDKFNYYGDKLLIENENDLHDNLLYMKVGAIIVEDSDYLYALLVRNLSTIYKKVTEEIEIQRDYIETLNEQWRGYYEDRI